jgi:hypothetical protein
MAKLILTGRILGILWTTASWSSTEESIQVVKINNKFDAPRGKPTRFASRHLFYHEKRAFFLKSLDKLTYSDIIIIVIVTIREIKERRY